MARGATRNQRPVDYSALGKKGRQVAIAGSGALDLVLQKVTDPSSRRTGAELPDTGQRDENGLEPIPSFSSPRKTDTPKTNGIFHDESTYNGTYTADETMEMESGTAPDPTDIIQNTRRQSMPRSSPIKKIPMSGTPKRLPGRPSTRPSLPSEELENATPSHAPISQAPQSDKPGSLKRPKLGRPPKPTVKDKKKGPFDLSVSDDEQDAPQSDSIDPSLLDSNMLDDAPIEPEPAIDHSYDQQNDVDEDPPDSKEQDTTIQPIEGADPPLDLPEEDQNEPDATAGATSPPIPERPKNKGGRPPKAQSVKPNEQKRPPGRPGKQAQTTDPSTTQVQTTQNAQRGPKRKQPFADRDPNIKMKAQKKASKQTGSRADSAPPNSSYLISRSQTPMMDEGAITTRSGRTVYKPLASWRGEKAVFARRESINTLGAIQEIVRTEEMLPPPRPKAPPISRRKRSARGRSRSVIAEEEEEEDALAEWEATDGIQHATVMAWDAEAQKYDEEYTEEVEIGFAASAMKLRDIQSATFQFAKTLTLPFFGSGMVGIPPGGEKRVKNSRKMQMVFFVFYGRVTVNVGTPTATFSIGKGGQWQVPRGNFYSIANESETHDARLFFAQGCQWNGEDDMGNAASAE